MPPMMEIITAEQLMEYLGKAATRFYTMAHWSYATDEMEGGKKTQFCVWLLSQKLT